MTRAWFRLLPLVALAACGPKTDPSVAPIAPTKKQSEPPPLSAGPSWEPQSTVAGVHLDPCGANCVGTHEATLSGEIDATGLPVVKKLSLAQGHCYQLSIAIEGPLSDAHFALVDHRGQFAASGDAPAPLPTLLPKSVTVPHNGALCIDSPTELSLSAAAGSGAGKFQATLLRVK